MSKFVSFLIAPLLGLTVLQGCTVSGGPNIDITQPKNPKEFKFVDLPILVFQAYKIDIQQHSEGYSNFEVNNLEAGRLRLPVSSQPAQGVQLSAFIASKNKLSEEDLLKYSVNAVSYEGKTVIYDGDKFKLPACNGLINGYKLVSPSSESGIQQTELFINMDEPNKDICLLTATLRVPQDNTSLSLKIDQIDVIPVNMPSSEKISVANKITQQSIQGQGEGTIFRHVPAYLQSLLQ